MFLILGARYFSLRLALSAIGLRERRSIQQQLSDGKSRLSWALSTQPNVSLPRRSAVAISAPDASFHFGSTPRSVCIPKLYSTPSSILVGDDPSSLHINEQQICLRANDYIHDDI